MPKEKTMAHPNGRKAIRMSPSRCPRHVLRDTKRYKRIRHVKYIGLRWGRCPRHPVAATMAGPASATIAAPASPTATPAPSSPKASADSNHLHHAVSQTTDDPLHQVPAGRPSADVGTETIHEPEPPVPSDEVTSSPVLSSSADATCQLGVHALAQRGDIQAITRLLQADPSLDLSSRDSQDVTPLHWAAINAHIPTCRFLLDNGADVDPIGGDLHATPLQWAARNGHLYVVHLLLSRGADPSIRDAQGFNTLQLITHSSAVMPLLYMVSGRGVVRLFARDV